MALYLSFYFVSLLFVTFSFDKYFKIVSNHFVFAIFCFAIMCTAGFRHGIATDYWSYYEIFNEKGQYDRLEPGFKYLIKIYKYIFNSTSYNGFVFFTAFLSIFLKYLFFIKLKNPYIALISYVAIFYFNLEYNVIRHGLAIAFIFHAALWARKGNLPGFLILTGLASSMHISSILFFPLYFLFRRGITLKTSTVFIFILMALSVRYIFVASLLLAARAFSGVSALAQLSNYFFISDFSIVNFGVFRRVMVVILFLSINNSVKINNCYFNLYLIGTLLYILFMGNDIFAHRISLSFDAFMIPLFADVIIKRNYKNIGAVFVLVSAFFTLYLVTINAEGYVLPYQSYIFN